MTFSEESAHWRPDGTGLCWWQRASETRGIPLGPGATAQKLPLNVLLILYRDRKRILGCFGHLADARAANCIFCWLVQCTICTANWFLLIPFWTAIFSSMASSLKIMNFCKWEGFHEWGTAILSFTTLRFPFHKSLLLVSIESNFHTITFHDGNSKPRTLISGRFDLIFYLYYLSLLK